MVRTAVPDVSVTLPIVIEPSLNVTVPVGDAPVTVAVKVTGCEDVAGLALDDKVVVDGPTL